MELSDERFVASDGQLSSDLGDEAVILNMPSATYYGVMGVGMRIWQLVQEPRTARELRDVLLEEYEISAEECERALVRFLGELRDAGLIVAKE